MRDYVALLKQIIPEFPDERIHITKYIDELWEKDIMIVIDLEEYL